MKKTMIGLLVMAATSNYAQAKKCHDFSGEYLLKDCVASGANSSMVYLPSLRGVLYLWDGHVFSIEQNNCKELKISFRYAEAIYHPGKRETLDSPYWYYRAKMRSHLGNKSFSVKRRENGITVYQKHTLEIKRVDDHFTLRSEYDDINYWFGSDKNTWFCKMQKVEG